MRLWTRLMEALGIEVPELATDDRGNCTTSYEDWCNILRSNGIPVGYLEEVCLVIPNDLELPGGELCETTWVKSLPTVVDVLDSVVYESEIWVHARLSHRLYSNWRYPNWSGSYHKLSAAFYSSLPSRIVVRKLR